MKTSVKCCGLILVLGVGGLLAFGQASKPGATKATIERDEVVAGGPNDFMEVRHVVLRGTNEAIGRSLAILAHERFQLKPDASSDHQRTRVQRRYIEKQYPILFERMRGVAGAFGHPVEDDQLNFSALSYPTPLRAGCSVMYFPPGVTATGTGIFSRDYDFTTGTLWGTRPRKGELPCTARPYVIEMHPDHGYASLSLCSYDLLSGVLDGINSEGLTVALLADDELLGKFPMEPAGQDGVGLGVLQVLRFLLDTCANVNEAKEALLLTKQYYEFIPVHYIIADRHGQAFVWEYSQSHNREYIVDNPGKPLITTNFSLHRYLQGKGPPSVEKAKAVCPRYCTLSDRLTKEPGKLTVDFIKETHKTVDAVRPSAKNSPRPPGRTLWHALYVPEQRSVQVSFYLGDEPEPDQLSKIRVVRSGYKEFGLRGR